MEFGPERRQPELGERKQWSNDHYHFEDVSVSEEKPVRKIVNKEEDSITETHLEREGIIFDVKYNF